MSEPKKVNLKRVPTKEQDPHARARNFNEVNYGYDAAEAKDEAGRCLFCKKPQCVIGCPVMINIPGFVNAISKGDYFEAYHILMDSNVMPAVCGRVCPQETQCEERCILGKKGDAVSVGKLERFVGDWAIKQGLVKDVKPVQKGGKKVAIVGSGPSAIACAHDLARAGVDVTVYEALHTAGGVLKYGIPNFRLPNEVVDIELEKLNKLGVKFELNKVIGRIFTIPDLRGKMGFNAVFIGTGAGTPKFMGIPGEGLNGMLSSNEFLTRVNLMEAYKFPNVDTPVVVGKKVAVVGAGNTAMDSVRTA
ncbi:MAG: FAD-dependent oxidoreductase, partial [Deltaproteobacteria bacterium]|nr:FAD-dependent oxidoreductase [Deltaproteobacteria bacterium]